MPRPIQAHIHTAALQHNLQRVQSAVPDAKVWAVVKANAYGHGIERVFEGLRAAQRLCPAGPGRGRARRAGLAWPHLLLEGVFEPRDLELCSRLGLWHAVHCDEQIDWLAAHKTQVPHRVFLKMNSGMNRLGFTPARYRAAWARLNALPQVDEISYMTHFSDADGPRGIAHQMAAFNTATQDLPGERSLSNSAATLRHAADAGVRADWVRQASWCTAARPTTREHRRPLGPAAHHDAIDPAAGHPATAGGRHRGLRLALHGRRAAHHRRGRLRLCQRLPPPLRH